MNHDNLSSKVHPEQGLCNHCSRNPHYLVVHKTVVSKMVAFLLFASFFVFVTGYFLGKKKLAEDFSHAAERTSFSDQINFALTSLYDKELHTQKNKELALFERNDTDTQQVIQQPIESQPERLLQAKASPVEQVIPEKKWIAQLLGGTQKDVTEFAQRLDKKGISVVVKKRYGSTARGKKIHWYQAITQPYGNITELQAVVAQIKKLENIKVTQDTIVPLST